MTQQTSGHAPEASTGPGTGPATTQVARDEAVDVGRSAAAAGKNVAGTATEQAGEVAREVRRQAKDLFQDARGQASEQARGGQQKAAEGLRTLAGELHQMADGGDQHGPASDLAKQAADRIEGAADWLAHREPGDLIGEVRGLARRRPGAFLLGAALAGVLAGRLTRGAVDANRDDEGARPTQAPRPAFEPARSGTPAHLSYDGPGPVPGGAPVGASHAGGFPSAGGLGSSYPAADTTYPGPAYADPADPAHTDPTGLDPAFRPSGPPAHAARPGATTVGEYVEEFERGADQQHERPYPGGPR